MLQPLIKKIVSAILIFYLRFVEEHGSYHPDCKGHLIHKKYTQEARFGLAYTALSSAFCPFEGIDS